MVTLGSVYTLVGRSCSLSELASTMLLIEKRTISVILHQLPCILINKAGDEEDEAEDDEPDSGAAEKSEVANGNKSAGSALPIKRKRDNEDAAGGDN
ncbi:unnamed protein product [Triticum turgidum subsp. durum]|uniref:Uncharacterized protein n=1 Tax=Triticum turgidum subsp. durum TaxID=4567 RepID=A0A9R0SN38_TRITD|nr:unnamed protein product [Triticum turgidum subsp. durum]